MPNEYSDLLAQRVQRDQQTRAAANVASTEGITPEQALAGINHAPLAEVPASVGMRTPELVADIAAQRQQQNIMAQSEPVRKWAATADPAHVAATKDDFLGLSKIGSAMFDRGFFDDMLTQATSSASALGKDFNRLMSLNVTSSGLDRQRKGLPILGSVLGDALGVVMSPLAIAREPFARGIAASGAPLRDVYIFGPNSAVEGNPDNAPLLLNPADRQRRAGEWAQLAEFAAVGLGGRALGRFNPSVVTPPIKGVSDIGPEAAPGGTPRVPGPDAPPSPSPVAAVAEARAANIAEVQAAVAESKTFTRSPQLAEAYLAQQPGGDQPVAVDPDVLIELGAQGHNPFPELAQEIQAAAINGVDVEIPLSKYIAATSGQSFAEQLNVTSEFGGPSVLASSEPPAAVQRNQQPIEAAPPADFTPAEAERARTIAAAHTNAVDELVQSQRLNELFTDAKAVGMSESQFARYNNGIEEAIAEAKAKMTERAYAQIRRERLPDWKEAVAQNTARFEQELAQVPAVNAYSYLTRGKDALGAPIETPFKLDRADAMALYGKDLGLPDSMFRRGGVTADEAAEVLGYPTGADMIRDLAAMHEQMAGASFADFLKAQSRALGAQATEEQLGFNMSPEALYEAASQAINSPKIESFLAQELETLAKAQGLPFDKAALKLYAQERFASLPVKDAINLRKLESFVYKGGTKAEAALLKGDLPTAFRRKQQQYLHHLELAEAHKFLKTYRRVTRNVTRWARKRHIKSMEQSYLDRLHQALVQHGIATKRDALELATALDSVTLEKWIDNKRAQGQDLYYAPIPHVALNDLTVAQFDGFDQMTSSIAKVGINQQTALVNGRREEIAALVQEALDDGAGLPNKPMDKSVGEWRPKLGKARSRLTQIDAAHRILESLFDYLDGGTKGPHNRVLQWGANDAANTVDRLQAEIYAPIVDKFEALPKAIRNTYKMKLSQTTLLDPRDGLPVVLRRGDLLAILANMGTEANKIKLAEGYGTTPEAIVDLLDQYITREEAEFVQFIWDQLTDKLFPLADANAREMKGYGIKPEQKTPVKLAVASLKGGYYPLAYDPKFVTTRDVPGSYDPLDPTVKPFEVLSTPSGFEKARTAYVGPVSLSLDRVLTDHMAAVFTRIAYGRYIQSARRFILEPKIKELWNTKLGHEYYNLLMPWLEYQVFDVGRSQRGVEGIDALARGLRQNLTRTSMGFSYSVGLAQLQGAVPAFNELGLLAVLDGYKSFMLSAVTGRLDETIYDLSEEMKFRHWNLEQNVRDSHQELHALDVTATPMKVFHKKWADWSMKYINVMDKYTVSGAVWTAAFRQAKYRMEMSDGDAVRFADKMVRKTQGSGRPADLPAVQRPNNEFARLLTFAYTWPGRYYNLQAEALRAFRAGDWKSGMRKSFWTFLAIPIIAALASGELPDDKDDPEEWLGWVLQKVILGNVGTNIFTRDAANIIDRRMSGKSAQPGLSPLARLEQAGSQAFSKGNKSWVKAWVNLAGLMGIIPGGAGQMGKTAQFLYDVERGKQRPKSMLEWYRGLTTGQSKEKK